MSDATLPPIFIPSGVYGEPMLGTADMWRDPEGRYVKAADYLALKAKWEFFVKVIEQRDHVICGRCLNYVPGHATGAGDICDCFPRDATYTGDIKRE